MNLADLIPNGDVLLSLDPDELAIRSLQVFGSMPGHMLQHDLGLINTVIGHPQTPHVNAYPA
jgi:hypothetical protein